MSVPFTFGTDGIRGIVGKSPLTHSDIHRIGWAIGQWITQNNKEATILLMHDTRLSCSFVKASLESGLLLHSIHISDAGVLPTPAAAHLLKLYSFDCAIVISASHNPWMDNGIKIITPQGKINPLDELTILQYYHQYDPHYHMFGTTESNNFTDVYTEQLNKVFKNLNLKNIKIVIDCGNGALSFSAPNLLRTLGAHIIEIGTSPNGTNINNNCGAVHPEQLQKAVVFHNALIGFAFDGDGDRVVCVTRDGALRDGDDILGLLHHHPAYQSYSTVVGTSMSNQGLVEYLHTVQKNFIRTSVGDKYVAEKLIQHDLMLGGEPAGHIICRDLINTGDGLLVALRILEYMSTTDNWMFDTFQRYPQVTVNIPITQTYDLSDGLFKTIIEEAETEVAPGRLVIRFSGTESCLRIMVEAKTTQLAQEIAHSVTKKLTPLL